LEAYKFRGSTALKDSVKKAVGVIIVESRNVGKENLEVREKLCSVWGIISNVASLISLTQGGVMLFDFLKSLPALPSG
jgi:hypothetical protein